MKKLDIAYWVVTILLSVFILLGAVVDISRSPEAIEFFRQLGYPDYLLRFIGTMKVLGIITILQPKFPKIKEWAYAGLLFDTLGAAYSHLSHGDASEKFLPALTGLSLVLLSYVLYSLRDTPAQSA